MKYDCIVIGGGIIGCAVLDRLARRNLKVLLLEKQDDVASFQQEPTAESCTQVMIASRIR